MNFKTGDLISWEYNHYFNGHSHTKKTKHGEYLGLIKYTKNKIALVKFQGNKSNSKVPLSELKRMSNRRQNLIKSQKDIANNF